VLPPKTSAKQHASRMRYDESSADAAKAKDRDNESSSCESPLGKVPMNQRSLAVSSATVSAAEF